MDANREFKLDVKVAEKLRDVVRSLATRVVESLRDVMKKQREAILAEIRSQPTCEGRLVNFLPIDRSGSGYRVSADGLDEGAPGTPEGWVILCPRGGSRDLGHCEGCALFQELREKAAAGQPREVQEVAGSV